MASLAFSGEQPGQRSDRADRPPATPGWNGGRSHFRHLVYSCSRQVLPEPSSHERGLSIETGHAAACAAPFGSGCSVVGDVAVYVAFRSPGRAMARHASPDGSGICHQEGVRAGPPITRRCAGGRGARGALPPAASSARRTDPATAVFRGPSHFRPLARSVQAGRSCRSI